MSAAAEAMSSEGCLDVTTARQMGFRHIDQYDTRLWQPVHRISSSLSRRSLCPVSSRQLTGVRHQRQIYRGRHQRPQPLQPARLAAVVVLTAHLRCLPAIADDEALSPTQTTEHRLPFFESGSESEVGVSAEGANCNSPSNKPPLHHRAGQAKTKLGGNPRGSVSGKGWFSRTPSVPEAVRAVSGEKNLISYLPGVPHPLNSSSSDDAAPTESRLCPELEERPRRRERSSKEAFWEEEAVHRQTSRDSSHRMMMNDRLRSTTPGSLAATSTAEAGIGNEHAGSDEEWWNRWQNGGRGPGKKLLTAFHYAGERRDWRHSVKGMVLGVVVLSLGNAYFIPKVLKEGRERGNIAQVAAPATFFNLFGAFLLGWAAGKFSKWRRKRRLLKLRVKEETRNEDFESSQERIHDETYIPREDEAG